ncbi:amidohydrolase family protein [Virgibacillus oceani]
MVKKMKRYFHMFVVVTLLLSLTISDMQVSASANNGYDTIIRGGTIVDGSGLDRYDADVAIKDGYIAEIGDLSNVEAEQEIDAEGNFVAPGFIDVHSHASLAALQEAESPLSQGVTMEVLSPDGGGPTDLQSRIDLEDSGLGINIGSYIGFNSVWSEVVGNEDRRATDAEIEEMQALISEAMEKGAAGVSAGLFYRPAYFADTDQVIDVVSEASEWRTKFTNHQRNENNEVIEATEETIEIGEESGLAPVITHIKTMGPNNWGKSEEMMQLINDANERGVYTAADIYPYLRSQTGLTAIVPPWVEEGGRSAMLERFADPELRPIIEEEIEEIMYSRVQGPEGVYFPTKRMTLADYMDTGVGNPRSRTLLSFLNLNYDNEFDVDIEEITVTDTNGDAVYEYDFEGNDGDEWDASKFDQLHSYPSNAVTRTINDNTGHTNVAQRISGNASAYGNVTPAMEDVDDSETFMRFKVGDTMGSNQIIRLWINSDNFGSGSSFAMNGYGVAVRLDQDRIQVQEREDASTTLHDTITDAGIEPDTWLDLKVKLEDDTLLVKMWPADEEEPEEWDSSVDVTNEDEDEDEERELTAGETTMQILETEGSLRSIYDFGHEDDFRRFIQSPVVAIASDGGASTSNEVHPRRYGTQPRVLGHYVREEGLLAWEEAVQKMTSLPAALIGLSDRGYLAAGMKADITIFDPDTVIDNATFEEPRQFADGIEQVLVNGELALNNGELTGIQVGEFVEMEPNMPTRPVTQDENVEATENRKILSLDGSETGSSISFNLEQGESDHGATGSMTFVSDDMELIADDLGRIQTYDDWVSFTGSGTINGETFTTFRVTVDENDPTIDDERPVVTIDIVGQDQIKGLLGEEDSEPPEEPVSIEEMKQLVDEFREDGEIENDETARHLNTHLTAVSAYEAAEEMDKAIRHMNSFKQLLDFLESSGEISEEASSILNTHADHLLENWQQE